MKNQKLPVTHTFGAANIQRQSVATSYQLICSVLFLYTV